MTLKRDHTAGSESKPSTIDVVPLAFHGRRILDMTFRGRRAWLLSDVETSLEYEPNGLGSSIRREWAPEFKAGQHYDVVRGDDLRALRCALDVTGFNPVSSKSPSITIVYEAGLDLIALKTDKPVGRELRAFLVERVLPQLRAGEGLAAPTQDLSTLIERVMDMAAKLDAIEQRDALRAAAFEGAAMLSPAFRRSMLVSLRDRCAATMHRIQRSASLASHRARVEMQMRAAAGVGNGAGTTLDTFSVAQWEAAMRFLRGLDLTLARLVPDPQLSLGTKRAAASPPPATN